MAGEFAEKYPRVAGRLLLQSDTCEDPHVERLIEAFALLAGRVHRKLDDEFPEITEALLHLLYGHPLAVAGHWGLGVAGGPLRDARHAGRRGRGDPHWDRMPGRAPA